MSSLVREDSTSMRAALCESLYILRVTETSE